MLWVARHCTVLRSRWYQSGIKPPYRNVVISNTDQRGESRPHDFAEIDNATDGDGSDIGAFEVQP
jgi:hypothetical protein